MKLLTQFVSVWSVLLLLLFSTTSLASAAVPAGLALIALTDKWQVMVEKQGELIVVEAIRNPRVMSYSASTQRVAFIGSDSVLYTYDLNAQTTTPVFDTAGAALDSTLRYTQPFYSQDGKWLYLVEMPDGKSRSTNIVAVSGDTGRKHYLVRKRSAQFEPYTRDTNDLFYSTASCVDDCEGMIWEIWQRENDTAKQFQLTLLNHVSNQPHLSADNWLYFSSNAPDRYYHIWRMRPQPGAPVEQLTFGSFRDSEPVTDQNGTLFFIRKTPSGTSLMRLEGDEAVQVTLPDTIMDIRNLEIKP
ncbi:TolB family protein [Granulosicoccus antarcticus]|uniref:Protein TolB n=1 Tax=Granulosicoccus antarcticus IMCC3135 TaxID=1192854 RepID=A0A2Z2NY97_9GAMM|nr:hypothetical protein [Granulosicoccus antarcticus]ASJ76269.1 hypothetical protein IMCC3135_31100 [Granulosicoccus antarcticus IMCC3135]